MDLFQFRQKQNIQMNLHSIIFNTILIIIVTFCKSQAGKVCFFVFVIFMSCNGFMNTSPGVHDIYARFVNLLKNKQTNKQCKLQNLLNKGLFLVHSKKLFYWESAITRNKFIQKTMVTFFYQVFGKLPKPKCA